ncbi:MAG: DUF488 domain-containing protein [Tepidibacillus sp.]
MNIKTKRIYEPVSKDDGKRILVDRLWPRGLSKDEVMVDLWLKQIAPSSELRKWFNHQIERFEEFRKAYTDEIFSDVVKQGTFQMLKTLANQETITLLYAAKDETHNQAKVLFDLLTKIEINTSNEK